jgi:VWFA-related protein
VTLVRAVAVGCLLAPQAVGAQQPTFRGSAATVVVDVSVTNNGKDVPNLTAADFRLTDNGVAQTITRVTREALPIDVVCVADISSRTEGPLLDSFRRAFDEVIARLGGDDRASLVFFDPHIREIVGFEKRRLSVSAETRASSGGASVLIDALASSIVRSFDPGRRRMAVVFSDGQDAGSFLDESDVMDVAARSGVTIFAVAVTDGTTRTPQRPANVGLLSALAEVTGGAVEVVQRDEDVSVSFIRAFNAFRTSYVVQYTPAGVTGPGWHELDVRLVRPGRHTVRARKGYFGDAAPAAP